MTIANKAVQVGIGVLTMHQGKVLVGKRIGSHGANTWQLAGGHLEFGETFEECAIREAQEETGLNLDPASAKVVTANNNIMSDIDRHYVTVFISANVVGNAEAKVMEPLKCERWEWITQGQLLDDNGPYRPLFSPLAKLITEHDLTSVFAQSARK
ncbi:Nudix hydrolase 15, mitochondrial [Lobosporangium transversale]|uniref:NUDIX hydrolase domain-like protein n=1 Tax=Lobosporangium transversale TaxID=64571 RepID=A0A1Y2GET2_9FUNG|nr:NUDIX hydrolase domain-like protein [Lobosporangium transversale]KAF9913738.1 Nudix hydrolase 15, mitochondrial [Lobosporangium transversale]ORZ08812.1 NUDIX hydrolase domain-like protein [Lobosporangium transversale]|eukprot:XP_021878595.1 NUDIX hydrolase domain-like protein [Lobosporangium transversale]